MKTRWNGSIQSSNTPTYDREGMQRADFALYRCMVIKALYVDNPNNISKNAKNPEVLYECVILGGFATGQTISNCRLAQYLNYSERNLTPSSKDISKTKLQDHDGDIVWIQFTQGHDAYPTILALAKGISEANGATTAQGPRLLEEYNGVVRSINNTGEMSLIRKGGSTANGRFTAGTAEESSFNLKSNEANMKTAAGAKVKVAGAKVAIGAGSTELLQKISDSLDKLVTWANSVGAAHTHLGNLGYPTAPPQQAADYTQLGTDLNTIKSAIDAIKGSL